MSEYTREEILKLIEEHGGPVGLDLSGKDLSDIDLSREAIGAELEKARERAPDETPVWYHVWTRGINLAGANLRGANLGHANLQGANLKDANLQGANLGYANLQGAFLAGANLQGAFLYLTNLQGAQLGGASLQEADLGHANLQGANLSYSHLEKVDLFDAKSLEGTYFYNAFLDDTRMRREQLGRAIGEELEGRYDWAKEAYLALKNNFAEIGRYRDESWAYVKERKMGKMCSAPWRARRFYGESQLGDTEESRLPAWHPRVLWFYARHTWKWFWDWVAELVCGYGESVGRVLATMAVMLVGFSASYWANGAVVDHSGTPVSSLLDYLIFSLGAFTTLGFRGLEPANRIIEFWTNIQAMLGIGLTGLLGFVLGNRIRRS